LHSGIGGLVGADLNTRAPSSRFYLSSQGLAVPAHLFAAAIPPLGAVMAQVFKYAYQPVGVSLTGLDVFCDGYAGAAVKLQLANPWAANGTTVQLTSMVGMAGWSQGMAVNSGRWASIDHGGMNFPIEHPRHMPTLGDHGLLP
jgi:hypothetical protein